MSKITIILLLFTSTLSASVKNWKLIPNLPSPNIYCVAAEKNGTIWAGGHGYLARIRGDNLFIYDSTNSPIKYNWHIWDIQMDQNGLIWIGTSLSGLLTFNGTSWTIYNTINSGIPANFVTGIGFENDTIKWLSSFGVAKYNNVVWNVYNSSNSPMPSDQLTSIAVRNNLKFIGTSDAGLVKYDNSVFTIYNSTNSGLPFNEIHTIKFDNDYVWIGTGYGGLARYSLILNSWKVYTQFNSPLPSNHVYSVNIQTPKNRWFGLLGGLGNLKNDTDWTVYTNNNAPLPKDVIIRSMALDSNKNLWLGMNAGLMEFNENGIVGINTNEINIPKSFSLSQNYPNPFNSSTLIEYELKEKGFVNLDIHDVNGKLVERIESKIKQPGNYRVSFYNSSLSTGVYFYTLIFNGNSLTKKFIILK